MAKFDNATPVVTERDEKDKAKFIVLYDPDNTSIGQAPGSNAVLKAVSGRTLAHVAELNEVVGLPDDVLPDAPVNAITTVLVSDDQGETPQLVGGTSGRFYLEAVGSNDPRDAITVPTVPGVSFALAAFDGGDGRWPVDYSVAADAVDATATFSANNNATGSAVTADVGVIYCRPLTSVSALTNALAVVTSGPHIDRLVVVLKPNAIDNDGKFYDELKHNFPAQYIIDGPFLNAESDHFNIILDQTLPYDQQWFAELCNPVSPVSDDLREHFTYPDPGGSSEPEYVSGNTTLKPDEVSVIQLSNQVSAAVVDAGPVTVAFSGSNITVTANTGATPGAWSVELNGNAAYLISGQVIAATQTGTRPTTISQIIVPTNPDAYLNLFGANRSLPAMGGSPVYVSTLNALASAYASAGPGSVIVIRNGTYNWGQAAFSGPGGASGSYVTIRPESPDGVTFTGSLTLTFQGAYTDLCGFRFVNVSTVGSWLVSMQNSHSRIRKSYVDNVSGNHCFAMYGDDLEASDNVFRRWPRLAIYFRSVAATGRSDKRHWYHHNEFSDSVGQGTPYMLGYAYQWRGTSNDDEAGAIVEWNLFDGPQADPETIAVKSAGNIIRYNYFRNGGNPSAGVFNHLSIRLGDNNLAYGNLFKYPHAGYTTRVSGHNYSFLYNTTYLDELSHYHTMAFLHGEKVHATKPYSAAKNGQYRRNIFVNGANAYAQVRDTYSASSPHAPSGNVIDENLWLGGGVPGYADGSTGGIATPAWFAANNTVDVTARFSETSNGVYSAISGPHGIDMDDTIIVPNATRGPITVDPASVPWIADMAIS